MKEMEHTRKRMGVRYIFQWSLRRRWSEGQRFFLGHAQVSTADGQNSTDRPDLRQERQDVQEPTGTKNEERLFTSFFLAQHGLAALPRTSEDFVPFFFLAGPE